MSNFAINDAGDVMEFDGQSWKPARMAVNDKGEKAFFDGREWKSVAATVGAGKGKADARNTSDATAQAFGQGATFGFGDELTAAVRAAAPGFSNWMMRGPALQRDESIGGSPTPQTVSTAPTMQGRYDEELARERIKAQQFQKDSPVLATGANIAGNVAGSAALSMVPGVAPLMSGAGGVPMQMLKGATAGAALGGAQAFGEGEGGFAQRAAKVPIGAGVGAGVGVAIPPLVAGGRALYEAVAPSVMRSAGNTAERLAPRADAGKMTLSAAAPEGGTPPPADSLMLTVADALQGRSQSITNDAALRRVARALQQENLSPAQIRAQLDDLGPDAFLSDLGRNLQRPARDAYVLPGEGQRIVETAFDNRNRNAPYRMITAFEGGPGRHHPSIREASEYLRQYTSAEGRRIYDPVLRGDAQLNVSPEMAELQRVPLIQDAYVTMRRLFQEAGHTPTEAELAHAVKQGLAANGQAAREGGRPVSPHLVSQVESAWRRALHQANPAIRAADEAYAPIAALPDRLTEGQQFLKTGISETATDFSPSALADRIPQMSPQERTALGTGVVNTARDLAAEGPERTRALAKKLMQSDPNIGIAGRLPYLLPDQASEIMRNARAEGVFAKTDRSVRGGAAERAGDIQAAFSDLTGSIPTDARGIVARLLDQGGKIVAKVREPNEATRAQIARLLTTGDNTVNAETLALVEALLRQQASGRPIRAGIAASSGSAASNFGSSP